MRFSIRMLEAMMVTSKGLRRVMGRVTGASTTLMRYG